MKVFKEEQRFSQSWLIALVIISALVPFVILLNEFLKEDSTLGATEFIIGLSVLTFFTSFIFFFKLKTKIDEIGIHYQFFPFHLSIKLIPWSDIEKASVRKYAAITEYGGWGLKGGTLWNKSKGRAINISGDIGIQLELVNGKKLLIGTQKEDEAKRVLENYHYKIETK